MPQNATKAERRQRLSERVRASVEAAIAARRQELAQEQPADRAARKAQRRRSARGEARAAIRRGIRPRKPRITRAQLRALTWGDLQPTSAGGFRITVSGEASPRRLPPAAATPVHRYWHDAGEPNDDVLVFPPA